MVEVWDWAMREECNAAVVWDGSYSRRECEMAAERHEQVHRISRTATPIKGVVSFIVSGSKVGQRGEHRSRKTR
jgi:hypothetical protein